MKTEKKNTTLRKGRASGQPSNRAISKSQKLSDEVTNINLSGEEIKYLVRQVMEHPYEEKGVTSLLVIVYALTFQDSVTDRDVIRAVIEFELLPYITDAREPVRLMLQLMRKGTR